METRTNISEGEFSYTFNQATDIGDGKTEPISFHFLGRTVDLNYIYSAYYDIVTEYASGKVADNVDGVNYVYTLPVEHTHVCRAKDVQYLSAPVVAGSTPVQAGPFYTSVRTPVLNGLPNEIFAWSESHWLTDADGSPFYNGAIMVLPPDPDGEILDGPRANFACGDRAATWLQALQPQMKSTSKIQMLTLNNGAGPTMWVPLLNLKAVASLANPK